MGSRPLAEVRRLNVNVGLTSAQRWRAHLHAPVLPERVANVRILKYEVERVPTEAVVHQLLAVEGVVRVELRGGEPLLKVPIGKVEAELEVKGGAEGRSNAGRVRDGVAEEAAHGPVLEFCEGENVDVELRKLLHELPVSEAR